jgi:hypothetical protein
MHVGDEGTEILERSSPSHVGLSEPSLHNNICSTPSRLVREGTVNVMELCFSSSGELLTQEERAPKVSSALEASGWQRITAQIITMSETVTLDDVA